MDCKIEETIDGRKVFSVCVDGKELLIAQREIFQRVIEKISSSIADDFIKEHGRGIIESIDPRLVLNRSIACVVRAIGNGIDVR